MDKCSVIIVAGGKGERIKKDISKQFLNIKNIPILTYTINKFYHIDFVGEIIVVIPKEYEEFFKNEIVKKYGFVNIKIVIGGKERGNSVYNGLMEVADYEIVLIHDGVRPFVSEDVIRNVFENTKTENAVIPVTKIKDTIKMGKDNIVLETLDRNLLYNAQTPQGFKKDLIINAYKENINTLEKFTDDSSLVEKNEKVFMVWGEYTNIKITTEEDLLFGEEILKKYDINNNPKEVVEGFKTEEDGVIIYTDGGSSGNPGPGGYGIVMIFKDKEREFSQGYTLTTNNRMELLGLIVALEKLEKGYNVKFYSDSKYVVDSINKGWAKNWEKNNWSRGKNKKAANIDLWKRALEQISIHNVELEWVKGHSGNKYNERCDELVKEAMFSENLIKDYGYKEE